VLLNTFGIAVAGYSAVSAVILFLGYVFFIHLPNKSRYAIISGAVLHAALATLQVFHLWYFRSGTEPMSNTLYRCCLFAVPAFFYLFGRWAILPNERFQPVLLAHLLPLPLLFVLPLDIALPLLFLSGTGYAVWLGNVVYGLRAQRKQFRFEFFFFLVMSVLASVVLILGLSIAYIDAAWFYYFYAGAIGLGFAIMTVALIANPDLLGELSEAARVKYGASTLRDVDVDACLENLDCLMKESKVYRNENLSLGSLAQQLGISSHQLSELINSRLGMGFSRYIRERRVAAAQALLIASPSQSILSVSMETGFKSQSSFYAAFKEVTGQSPGEYRKAAAG